MSWLQHEWLTWSTMQVEELWAKTKALKWETWKQIRMCMYNRCVCLLSYVIAGKEMCASKHTRGNRTWGLRQSIKWFSSDTILSGKAKQLHCKPSELKPWALELSKTALSAQDIQVLVEQLWPSPFCSPSVLVSQEQRWDLSQTWAAHLAADCGSSNEIGRGSFCMGTAEQQVPSMTLVQYLEFWIVSVPKLWGTRQQHQILWGC